MLEILQNIIATLLADATILTMVPSGNILVGPVDMLSQKQDSLIMPSIILSVVAESQRPVPQYARDSQIQMDIWTRESQLVVENIYERVIAVLNYLTYDENTAHICWQILGGARDDFETDRRVWHRAMTFQVWSVKPH